MIIFVYKYVFEWDNFYFNFLFSFFIFNNVKFNLCLIFYRLVLYIGFLYLCFFFKFMVFIIVCLKVKDFFIFWKKNVEININFRIIEYIIY